MTSAVKLKTIHLTFTMEEARDIVGTCKICDGKIVAETKPVTEPRIANERCFCNFMNVPHFHPPYRSVEVKTKFLFITGYHCQDCGVKYESSAYKPHAALQKE